MPPIMSAKRFNKLESMDEFEAGCLPGLFLCLYQRPIGY